LLDQLHAESIALLKQMIAIPSPSREEGQVCSYIFDWLKKRELNPSREKNNIWLSSIAGEGLPVILLNSHIDTVKPVSGWTYDPFIPMEEGDKISGLGSNDAGASVVSLIAAYILLSRLADRKYNLILALTSEEEVSGSNGIELIYPLLGRVDLAIVGEPTSLKMAVCERGLLVLDCTAKGKAAHVANRNGENAIYNAFSDISILKSFNFPKVSSYLGSVQVEVTQIQGGTQHNVLPDSCNFVVDIRTNELYTHEEILAMISRELKSELKPRSMRLKSSILNEDHPLMAKASQIGIDTTGSATLSDMALLACPSVKMGPGHTSRSHQADEYIYKDEIKQGIQTYYDLLKDFVF
jgi:acetylornithine deacetylase